MKERVNSWLDSIKVFSHPRVITMLFLGFSAGIPILLIFSSLGLWLNEAGIKKSTVTLFSWAALGYSFKFVWAPLIDRLPVPYLTKTLGRRRAWMLIAQLMIVFSIVLMAATNPISSQETLHIMAIGAVLLGFSSATQDIVIDAYRIESAKVELQSMMAATYITGYRLGMLVAGAGALKLAYYFGSSKNTYVYDAWFLTYVIMASVMLVGIITTLIISEPKKAEEEKYLKENTSYYLKLFALFLVAVLSFIMIYFLSVDLVKVYKKLLTDIFLNRFLSSFVVETLRLVLAIFIAWLVIKFIIVLKIIDEKLVVDTYINPIKDFFKRYGTKIALLLLLVIGFYRVSDIVMGVIANIFYQDIGFSKDEIANISKTYGLFMTIAGSFVGGILSMRYGVFRILLTGAVLASITNLLFILLANVGHDKFLLYVIISADNLSAGLAQAAFIAFISSLTNIKFTAVQYAVFSSIMTLFPKILGGYSGSIVESFGYSNFFTLTAIMGIPVLYLVWKIRKYII